MEYYTETNYIDHDQLRTAGGKGRDDYFEVLRSCGLKCIRIPVVRPAADIDLIQRLKMEKDLRRVWKEALSVLGDGDSVVLHSPVSEKFTGYTGLIRDVSRRGCRIINIVFDLETYFMSDYRRFAGFKHALDKRTEAALFRISDVVICHNERMKEKLVSAGVPADKIVCVGVMDYLRRDMKLNSGERFTPDKPVVYCGNLAKGKSGFVYELPKGIRIDLYGPGFTGKTDSDICYKGVYPAFELMDLMEGSFGLVWDGPSSDTCTGACGEYLEYNNPHKMSHYLASGMPVLVWEGAAMAEYVNAEGCGVTISELKEIPSVISGISDERYAEMRKNAERVGAEMREGSHIRRAVETALGMAHENR